MECSVPGSPRLSGIDATSAAHITLLLAKAAALGLFLGVFLVDINFFGVLFWPGIDGRSDVLNIFACHITAVIAGGLFAALAIAVLQGLLMTFLGAGAFRRASVWIQTALICGCVMLLILAPLIGFRMRWFVDSNTAFLYWFPGFWFVGLYERLRPATHDPVLLHLGQIAIRALWTVAALFVLTYLPVYHRRMRKVLESPAPKPAGPGGMQTALAAIIDRVVLRTPVRRAAPLHQSDHHAQHEHRMFLATTRARRHSPC